MKKRTSILDPFQDKLEAWDMEGRTIAQMQTDLAALGCKVSAGRLSSYLESRRSARLQDRLFGMIATGGQMNQALDKAFAKDPPPEIAQLNRVVKTLVMSLQVQGTANPELLELATTLYKTVLDFAKLEAKQRDQALDERKLVILERQASQAEQTDKVLTNAELTPEQRAQRIKEIYGRA